jgi:hypothetical protein
MPSEMAPSHRRSGRVLLAVAALSLLALATAGAGRSAHSAPLIGVNYTHYANVDCSLANTGIVTHYQEPGIRRLVQAQLSAMHAGGAQTLRLLLWYMSNASRENWGPVSSGSGRLEEPYRSNLIRYLSDVRRAGFKQLTVSFSPEYHNLPLDPAYEPSTFNENWQFIRHVVPLVKRYGPASTHIDLSNEEPGGDWDSAKAVANTKTYVTKLWRKYVAAFGSADATFSFMGSDGPKDASPRLQNLVEALRASGKRLPSWFDVHPPYSYSGALSTLRSVDRTLTSDHLKQALVIGEEAYNDASVARAIKKFMATSSRPVLEVMEWPLAASRPCEHISVSAPYRVGAYLTTLTGRRAPRAAHRALRMPPIPTLEAVVRGTGVSLTTAKGRPVTRLASGEYRIVVHDLSSSDDFHLAGPDINRFTGLDFRGTVVWHVDIGRSVPYGRVYSFFSDRRSAKLRGSFRIR